MAVALWETQACGYSDYASLVPRHLQRGNVFESVVMTWRSGLDPDRLNVKSESKKKWSGTAGS